MKLQFRNTGCTALLAIASVAVMTACGGGGGGGSSSAGSSAAASNGSVAGTASNNILQKAKVTAYCGAKSTTSIGSTTTDMQGAYSIPLTAACDKPVLVVAEAVAGTTMWYPDPAAPTDTARGVTVPVDLATPPLKAFTAAPVAGAAVTLPVWPVSSAAAEKLIADAAATGAADVDKSKVELAQLAAATTFGVPVSAFSVAKLSDVPEAQTFMNNLHALEGVSNPAATLSDAEKAAITAKIKTTLGAIKAQPLVVVTATPTSADPAAVTIDPNVAPASALATLLAPVVGTTTPLTTSTKVADAKAILAALSKDMLILKGNGSDSMSLKTTAMQDDFKAFNGSSIQRYFYAIWKGPQLLADVAAGKGNYGNVVDPVNGNYSVRSTNDVVCKVYTTAGSAVNHVTSPASARCTWATSSQSMPSFGPSSYSYTYSDQLVVIQPTATANQFAWQNKARDRSCTTTFATGSTSCTDVLSAGTSVQSGTYTMTLTDTGDLTSLAVVNGKFQAMASGATDSTLNLTVTAPYSASVRTFAAKGSVTSGPVTLSILDGSTLTDTFTTTSDSFPFNFQASLNTGKFLYEGTLSGTGANSYGVTNVDTDTFSNVSFVGKVSEIVSGTAKQFFLGSLSGNTRKVTTWSTTVRGVSTVVSDGSVTLKGTITTPATGKVFTLEGSDAFTRDSVTGVDTDNVTLTYTNPEGMKVSAVSTDNVNITLTSGTTVMTLNDKTKLGEVKVSGVKVADVLKNKASFTDGTTVLIF